MRVGWTALAVYLVTTALVYAGWFDILTGSVRPFWNYDSLTATLWLPLASLVSLFIFFRAEGPKFPFLPSGWLILAVWPSWVMIVLAAASRFVCQIIGIFTGQFWGLGLAIDVGALVLVQALSTHLSPVGSIYDALSYNGPRLSWGRIRGTRL